MANTNWRWMAVFLAMALMACGDDDDTPPGVDSGTAVDAGASDSGGGMDASASGMCLGTMDMTLLASGVDGATVSSIASNCAIMCISVPDAGPCVQSCIEMRTGLTSGCSTCVALSVGCSAENCLSACLADPSSPACLACQCGGNPAGINCREVYSACSGIPSNACDALDGGTVGGDAGPTEDAGSTEDAGGGSDAGSAT